MIAMDYNSQLTEKEKRLLHSLGDLKVPPLEETVRSQELHFRNKAKFVVTGTTEKPVIGLSGEETLDEGRELLDCSLHVQKINDALPFIEEFITTARLQPYQIALRTGELKGLILFYSQESDEMYLRFIMRSKESLDRIKKHQQILFERIPSLKCLSINIQPIPHAVLEGEEEIIVSEQKYIHHKTGSLVLNLGPRAFVQTNQTIATLLYQTASLWIKEKNCEKFMELFCGQGAFSFFAAPFIKEGMGVEINPEAVSIANETSRKYGYSHLQFLSADAGSVNELISKITPDVLLVNPPRRGLGSALGLVKDSNAETFIYSSCNNETLAHDLKLLSDKYEIKKIQIFDMFPHTSHFETLVELKKKF